jgi:RNA polymerase sigma factor (sigma-70 family)
MVVPFAVPQRESLRGPRVVHLRPVAPPLAPVLDAATDVAPAVDRVLTAVAFDARGGCVAARDALYAACEPKISRFVRRYRSYSCGGGRGPAIDPDDLAQEAYLVFVNLVAGWPGGDSFCAYFLGHFPWALRNAVRRLALEERRSIPFSYVPGIHYLADGSAAAEEAVALLDAIAADLPDADGHILVWRIRDGESFGAIARRLGVNRQTVFRAWERIVAELGRTLKS